MYKRKIGTLPSNFVKYLKGVNGDIFIDYEHVSHISVSHAKELRQLGFCAIDYVRFILRNYNQIRQGRDDSLLLVVFKQDLHDVAAIRMVYDSKANYWLVRTAQPRSTDKLSSYKILWKK